MKTFTLTYKQEYTLERVQRVVEMHCKRANTPEFDFQKLCGSVAYAAVLLLPEHERYDRGIYSIDHACLYVNGFFKYCMHDLLEDLGQLACSGYDADVLKHILSNECFYECMDFLQLPAGVVYRALLYHYLKSVGSNVLYEYLLELNTFSKLMNYFENEVNV